MANIGCNFSVLIAPIELRGNFAAVSGLGSEIDYDIYNEGGNFTSPIYLPKGMKSSNIVLERGTVTLEPLSIWYSSVQLGIHLRYPMIITMKDSSGRPVKIWTVMNAMPVKIEYSAFDAMQPSIATTTIELIHDEIIPIM